MGSVTNCERTKLQEMRLPQQLGRNHEQRPECSMTNLVRRTVHKAITETNDTNGDQLRHRTVYGEE